MGQQISAQILDKDSKKVFQGAQKAFYSEYHEEALEMFVYLDSLNPKNGDINFYIGLTQMRMIEHREKSLPYFEKALLYGYGNKSKPTLTLDPVHDFYESEDFNFNIARAYHLNYQFDKAIDFYNEFLQEIKDKYHGHHKKDVEIVQRFVENCKVGRELVKDTLDVVITNLGPTINTKYEEIAPVITADEKILIFTSRRPQGENAKTDVDNRYSESTYKSINLGGGEVDCSNLAL
ncbi:hypothetical protein OAH12_00145 [Cyclobacteriaceae bacterium]|nr:hypothetical protein [Cyclobacteriaceae bacterium]